MSDFAATRLSPTAAAAAAERTLAFLRSVYGWMFVVLGVTALVAAVVAASPAAMRAIASNHLLFPGALVAELGIDPRKMRTDLVAHLRDRRRHRRDVELRAAQLGTVLDKILRDLVAERAEHEADRVLEERPVRPHAERPARLYSRGEPCIVWSGRVFDIELDFPR